MFPLVLADVAVPEDLAKYVGSIVVTAVVTALTAQAIRANEKAKVELKAAETKAAAERKAAEEKAAAELKAAEAKAAAEKKELEDKMEAERKEALAHAEAQAQRAAAEQRDALSRAEAVRDAKMDVVLDKVTRMENAFGIASAQAQAQAAVVNEVKDRINGISRDHGPRLAKLEAENVELRTMLSERKRSRRS